MATLLLASPRLLEQWKTRTRELCDSSGMWWVSWWVKRFSGTLRLSGTELTPSAILLCCCSCNCLIPQQSIGTWQQREACTWLARRCSFYCPTPTSKGQSTEYCTNTFPDKPNAADLQSAGSLPVKRARNAEGSTRSTAAACQRIHHAGQMAALKRRWGRALCPAQSA
jgi:hypothetical protein